MLSKFGGYKVASLRWEFEGYEVIKLPFESWTDSPSILSSDYIHSTPCFFT